MCCAKRSLFPVLRNNGQYHAGLCCPSARIEQLVLGRFQGMVAVQEAFHNICLRGSYIILALDCVRSVHVSIVFSPAPSFHFMRVYAVC